MQALTDAHEVRLSYPGPGLFLRQDLSHYDATPQDSLTQEPQAVPNMDLFLYIVQLFFKNWVSDNFCPKITLTLK